MTRSSPLSASGARALLGSLDRSARSVQRLEAALDSARAQGRRAGHRQGLREALVLAAELRLGPLPISMQRRIQQAEAPALRTALERLLRGRPDPLQDLPPEWSLAR
jgi:hypothetical protein